MCASYGLGGGPYSEDQDLGIEPLDTREGRAALDQWLAERHGRAAITGKNARNLNPIILADAGGDRSLEFAWWWLWLDGSGPVRFSAFNSRDDKLMSSWRAPFQKRALLPATWYVEKKVRFGLPAGETFGIAALTSTVVDEATGAELVTYSMVTRDAVGKAAETWPRMPLVLPRELHDEWLDPDRPGDADLVAQIQHASAEISAEMTAGGERPTEQPALF